MLGLSKYSWVFNPSVTKAKYWQHKDGSFWWHNPESNQVEPFKPNQGEQHELSTEPATPSVTGLIEGLRSEMAAAAQKIVDEWQPDEEDMDEEYGAGGVCDAIANELGGLLANQGLTIQEGGQEGDDHAYLIAHNGKEGFVVDIPPSVYETGGGYSWKKRKDAKINPDDISIEPFTDMKYLDVEERRAAYQDWMNSHKQSPQSGSSL